MAPAMNVCGGSPTMRRARTSMTQAKHRLVQRRPDVVLDRYISTTAKWVFFPAIQLAQNLERQEKAP
jgi:hypothetical protein